MAQSNKENRAQDRRPLEVFCSYDQNKQDEALLEELEQHLAPLQSAEQLVLRHQGQIVAGENRAEIIKAWEARASAILLLVSSAYLASDICKQEIQQAMQQRYARVIPVILRPCDWNETVFSGLQCLPRNKKPITIWVNRDEAWEDVTKGIHQSLNSSTNVTPPIPQQDRKHMLRYLHHHFSDLMQQSLQGVVQLELGLAKKPNAVQNATNRFLRVSNRREQLLPPGTPIMEVYDKAEHKLLILGEPSAGKSMLLLDLAQQLVERAEQVGGISVLVGLTLETQAEAICPAERWRWT